MSDRMSDEELKQLGREAAEEVREEGVPESVIEGDKVIRIYPDGRKTEMVYEEGEEPFEVPYTEEQK